MSKLSFADASAAGHVVAPAWQLSRPAALAAAAVAVGVAAGASVVLSEPVVPAICIATSIACLAVLRWPFAGVPLFVVVAACLPFAVLPLRLVLAPTLVDLVLTALLISWVARVLHRDEMLVTSHLGLLVTLFIGLAVVALILGMSQSPISGETVRLFLKFVNSALLFFSVVQVVRDDRQLATIVRTLLLVGGLAASLAVVLYGLPAEATLRLLSSLEVIGYPTAEVLRPVAGTDTLRATGTSVDPNILGALLMLVGVVLVAQLLARRPVLPRMLLGLIGAPVALALALTYSRSSWVGLAAGLAFLAVGRSRRAGFVLALGAAAVVLVPPARAFIGRLGEAVSATDPATVMRLAEYGNALQIIARYPWFGIGFGSAPSIELAVGVSSVYLLIAEQMGLIGLACFIAIAFVALARSVGTRPVRDSRLHGLLAAVEAAFFAALVAGLFDHYFFNINFPHMVGVFWLVLGLLVVASRLASVAQERSELTDIGQFGRR